MKTVEEKIEEKLIDCPFCGGRPEVMQNGIICKAAGFTANDYQIVCCGIKTDWMPKGKLIKFWNNQSCKSKKGGNSVMAKKGKPKPKPKQPKNEE